MWKVLIRDDANRFQIENEEKRLKKRNNQVDYRSYLDKQMEHVRAQQVARQQMVQEDAV